MIDVNSEEYQKKQWDKTRQILLDHRIDSVYVDGNKCRSCVWANTESEYIICSRSCDGKRCYKSK